MSNPKVQQVVGCATETMQLRYDEKRHKQMREHPEAFQVSTASTSGPARRDCLGCAAPGEE